jgi:hypothetical protein
LQEKLTTKGTKEHTGKLTYQLAEEFLFVHAVLKRFVAVDEDDGNLVVVEAAEFGVGVDVHLAPAEAAALVEFDEAFLDDFAEMTPLAGIHDDLAGLRHGGGV